MTNNKDLRQAVKNHLNQTEKQPKAIAFAAVFDNGTKTGVLLNPETNALEIAELQGQLAGIDVKLTDMMEGRLE